VGNGCTVGGKYNRGRARPWVCSTLFAFGTAVGPDYLERESLSLTGKSPDLHCLSESDPMRCIPVACLLDMLLGKGGNAVGREASALGVGGFAHDNDVVYCTV
jgi:hypothetical protein